MKYRFGRFVLDTRCYELRREGEPQHLEPQVYAILRYLIENRDRLVAREELLDEVWGHRFITPGTLNSRIKALRQALDDDGSVQHVIRTIRGRGFRFVAAVSAGGGDAVVSEQVDESPTQHVANAKVSALPTAASQQQVIRFCRAGDRVRIAYALSGTGPPLVKPANWLTHLEHDWESPVWGHWLNELGRSYTLIRYDERGCGLSDHHAPMISFDAWVSDLEAVVDAAGLERFPMLGISQGCAVAIAYAARHPERVSRLVLYGGYPFGRNHRGAQQDLEGTLLRDLIRVGWGRDNSAFRQVFGSLFVPDGTPQQLQWFIDLTRTVPMENALRITELTHDIDIRTQAAMLNVPTIVLHSRGDAMIPFEAGRQLAALIPGGRFVPLESRNHVLLEHEPAWTRFLEETRTFLA